MSNGRKSRGESDYVGPFEQVRQAETIEFLERRNRHDAARDVRRPRLRLPMYIAVLSDNVVAYLEGRFDEMYLDPAWQPLTNTDRGAWIHEIETDPPHRRQGWARRLVRAFLLDAQAAGARYVALRIDHRGDQTERRAFFRALGLEPLKDDEPPYVHGASIQQVLQRLRSGGVG